MAFLAVAVALLAAALDGGCSHAPVQDARHAPAPRSPPTPAGACAPGSAEAAALEEAPDHAVGVPDEPARGAPEMPQVHSSLSKAIIRAVITARIHDVRACYEAGLRRRANLRGHIAIEFVIKPGGEVCGAAVSASDLGSPTTERCIAAAVGRWRFPRPASSGIVVVNYPFVLVPEGP